MENESASYEYLYDNIQDPILRQRAKTSLMYYIENANGNKRGWKILSILGIVLPALATVFVCTEVPPLFIGSITAATTVVSGLLALFKCADKKTSYRNSAESLKSELMAYAMKQGCYENTSEDPDSILYRNMERIIQDGYSKICELDKTADCQANK